MNIKQANSNVLESLIPLFQREEIICKNCANIEWNILIKQHKKDDDIIYKLLYIFHLIRYNILKQVEKISFTCSIIQKN